METTLGKRIALNRKRLGLTQDKLAEAVEIYRKRYIPIGRFENEPYPGIRELLEKLYRNMMR